MLRSILWGSFSGLCALFLCIGVNAAFGTVELPPPNTAVTLPLQISDGGTNATSAAGARTSLALAKSGANSDITSITALSTPLSVAQGGTAGATAAAARAALAVLGTAGGTMTGAIVTNSGVRMTTGAKGTCDVTARGMLWVVTAAGGVTDELWVCLKAAADTYSWISVKQGG